MVHYHLYGGPLANTDKYTVAPLPLGSALGNSLFHGTLGL